MFKLYNGARKHVSFPPTLLVVQLIIILLKHSRELIPDVYIILTQVYLENSQIIRHAEIIDLTCLTHDGNFKIE